MAIKEKGKNKYRIDIPIGYNGDRRIRHIETFIGTKKEAALRENELKMQLKTNSFLNKSKMTMEQLLDEWIRHSENNLSPKTLVSYKIYIRNIVKCIGHIHLQDINSKILEDFYNELITNTKYADKTIRHHYSIISTALNKAVIWGYILSNPNMRIEKPKVKKKEIHCYNPEQVSQLVNVLQNEPLKYQAIIMLALDSGCRRGEITGLTWEDVDFTKSTININKSSQYVSGKGIYEKSTKTETSNRTICISNTTIEILKRYKKEQLKKQLRLGDKWGFSKRLFTTEYGTDMHPDTPSSIFEIIIKKYDLPRITFHGLRHTSISLQIASGIQSQIISKRAGHSSIAITHNTYSHFFENGFKDVADKMDTFLKVN